MVLAKATIDATHFDETSKRPVPSGAIVRSAIAPGSPYVVSSPVGTCTFSGSSLMPD
jgi:hypothetical protein